MNIKTLTLFIMAFVSPTTLAAGQDDLSTPNINEGYIGTGQDDLSTPDVNEGYIGTGQDDLSTSNINEGAIDFNVQPSAPAQPSIKVIEKNGLPIVQLTQQQKKQRLETYRVDGYKLGSLLVAYLENENIYDSMKYAGTDIFVRKLIIVKMLTSTTAIVTGNSDIHFNKSIFNSDQFFVSGLKKVYKQGEVIDGGFMQDPNFSTYKSDENGKSAGMYKLIFVDDQILKSNIGEYLSSKKLDVGDFGSLEKFKKEVLPTLNMSK